MLYMWIIITRFILSWTKFSFSLRFTKCCDCWVGNVVDWVKIIPWIATLSLLKPQKSSRFCFKVNIRLNPFTIQLSRTEKNIVISWEWFGFNIKASNFDFFASFSALALETIFWTQFLHWLCYWWRFNQVKNDLLCLSIFCFIINLLSGWEWVYLVGKWTQSHFFWETLWWCGKSGKIPLSKALSEKKPDFRFGQNAEKIIHLLSVIDSCWCHLSLWVARWHIGQWKVSLGSIISA